MWQIKVLICGWFVFYCSAYRRKCSDCKLVSLCPEIASLDDEITEDIKQLIKNAFCDKEIIDGKIRPKICCSYISKPGLASPSVQPMMPDSLNTRFYTQPDPSVELLPENCGRIDGGRIVGGTIANLREFPWMALLKIKSRFWQHERELFKCGGTIISKKYILTAAHCVINKTLSKIRVGEFEIGREIDRQGEYPHIDTEDHIQELDIENVISHNDYNKEKKIADIALIRVKGEIDFSHRNVAPVCLPVQQELRNIVLDMRMATVAGWGITETGISSDILRKVDIPIYSEETCRQSKNEFVGDFKKLCAGAVGKDSCKGDSGGPLMIEEDVNKIIRVVQYGIVSYGPSNCASYSPGVYTNIAKYMDWILDHIKP